MSTNSKIEWTDATWNPVTGCTKVSPGCANCYIERTPPFRIGHRKFDEKGTTGVVLHPDRLEQPLKWRKPRRVFVNSLSDLFHESISNEYLDRIFAVMQLSDSHRSRARNHTFQVLTKRPQRAHKYLSDPETSFRISAQICKIVVGFTPIRGSIDWSPCIPWPLDNLWLGVSVENQHFADERIPLLLQTPAAVRFISAEPLLGPVDLTDLPVPNVERPFRFNALERHDDEHFYNRHAALDWVIVGGESGPGARPMHPEWARSLRDQCQAAGVKFFFKQWGEFAPRSADGCLNIQKPDGLMLRVGKKNAGRLLDGVEWNEFPQ